MRRFAITLFVLLAPTPAFAFGALACGRTLDNQHWYCASSYNDSTEAQAHAEALAVCKNESSSCRIFSDFSNECIAAANDGGFIITAHAPTIQAAREKVCDGHGSECKPFNAQCDPYDPDHPPAINVFNFGTFYNGITLGLGFILVIVLYAQRARLANFIIHGNLPQKIPVYAEDIQVLFKRTQRINWYGRVVFGIIARLSMDHKQFSLVRRYWLGRVIAFDSLRRQRQNQLARMHLQLAASLKPELSDKKPSSWLWIAIKYYFFLFFYLIRSLISFLIGFLFIRITIAKLIRGKLIESTESPPCAPSERGGRANGASTSKNT